MMCTLCNERNGNTRCEGCKTLFCLPCLNKHHDQLAQQFQLLMDFRNEVKQAIDASRMPTPNKKVSCFIEIDTWERESMQHIQKIAAYSRAKIKELIKKFVNEIADRFEQTSVQIQQQQKEGIYLETELDKLNNQLSQLKNELMHIDENIRIDSSQSNNIQWDTLLYVNEKETSNQVACESMLTKSKGTKEKKKPILDIKINRTKDKYDCDICVESCASEDIFIVGCEGKHEICFDCLARSCRDHMNHKKALTCGLCTYQLQDSDIKELRVPADMKKQYLEYQRKKTGSTFHLKLPF